MNELFFVKNEAFFNSLADDSDICISFTTDFGGAVDRLLIILGVIPLTNLCKMKNIKHIFLDWKKNV